MQSTPGPEKASREQSKLHNHRLVFKTIYDQGEISRVDIARQTRLTPTTVSSNVAELLEEGLVQETGQAPSVGGKPATLLQVVDDARHLIGVDLAGNHLRGALINLRGTIRHLITLPLKGLTGNAALQLVYQLIDQLVATATSPLLGIGIGTPGVIDSARGIVEQAVNVEWQHLPLRQLLADRYSLPVYIANDSHVTAVAERTFGPHKNANNLIVLKVGRGIGAGIVLNGRLFYGDGWGAGEIGHVVVAEDGPRCRCGNVGCLETVASSSAILARARQLGIQVESIEQLVALMPDGDQALHAIIAEAGHYLAIAVAHLVGALNVRYIILAGTVAQFGPALLEPLKAQLNGRALAAMVRQTVIEQTTLGAEIVTLGAAALLLGHELGLNA
jgi:N-acetylglucosamine repressor